MKQRSGFYHHNFYHVCIVLFWLFVANAVRLTFDKIQLTDECESQEDAATYVSAAALARVKQRWQITAIIAYDI